MKAGVSTACLFPMAMEQALHVLGEQGITLCECFFNTPSELKPETVRRMKAEAAFYGMDIRAIHPFTTEMESFFFFSAYPNRLEDGLELYKRYFEVAAELGAPYLVFHGEYSVSRFGEEAAFEHIRRLRQEGLTFGVELLHENVSRCKGGRPDYLAKMHRAIPELGFVLDCKQALRADSRPEDFVTALGDSIKHIHLSDNKDGFDCLPPGKGDWDLEGFFRLLREHGSTAEPVIELYSNSFEKPEDLARACDFTQRILDNVDNI